MDKLKENFLGVLKQSNWDYELDSLLPHQRKSILSRLYRRLKRWIVRIQN